MFGLITMLVTTLGATGMGSILKIIAGIFDRAVAAREAKEKRKILREANNRGLDHDFQKQVFGDATENPTIALHSRTTRRWVAIIGMCNFFVVSVACTLFPSAELITFVLPEHREAWSFLWGLVKVPSAAPSTVVISTGHIAMGSMATLSAIIGFYFTPGGRQR
jgi:hypothetical protein